MRHIDRATMAHPRTVGAPRIPDDVKRLSERVRSGQMSAEDANRHIRRRRVDTTELDRRTEALREAHRRLDQYLQETR